MLNLALIELIHAILTFFFFPHLFFLSFIAVVAVPKNCRDIKVGDRVLEINGVKSFNFQNSRRANDLFDTLYFIYHSKEEEMEKLLYQDNEEEETLSSEELARQRKGRRSKFEEEARQIGAERRDYKKNIERRKLLEEQEREFKRVELEQRRLERERRKAEEEARNAIPPPPPSEPKRAQIKKESNFGTFSPKASYKGWVKVSMNHKKNG